MSFENQKTDASREAFGSNEEQVAAKKRAIENALGAGDYDQVAALAQEAKGLEGDKNEMLGAAKDEATAENADRDMAKERDGAQGEANEMNQAFDESKAAEAAAKEKARIAEEDRLSAEADAAAAAKLVEQIKGGNVGVEAQLIETVKVSEGKQGEIELTAEQQPVVVQEQQSNPENVQQYLDEIAVAGDYVGTRLHFMPESVKANEAFMLKVAEYNPAEALSHASPELRGNKDFIRKLMQIQPGEEMSEPWNFHKVDFYGIDSYAPEFSKDKDFAMELIDDDRYDTVPAQLLEDEKIAGIIKQKELQKIIAKAQEHVQKKSGTSYIRVADFKVRDNGQTLGGDRWSLLNDDAFATEVKKALKPYGEVEIMKTKWQGDRGDLKFTPKGN